MVYYVSHFNEWDEKSIISKFLRHATRLDQATVRVASVLDRALGLWFIFRRNL